MVLKAIKSANVNKAEQQEQEVIVAPTPTVLGGAIAPAQQPVSPPVVMEGHKENALTKLNEGVVEGLDGIGGGNRVSIDGTDFEYRNQDRRAREITMVVNFARRVYQYWDDNSNLCQSYDGKTSTDGLLCATCEHKRAKECKFKFEVYWNEETEDGMIEEFVITLPTVSAIQFVNYLKALAREGLGVGQVITQMTIRRETNTANNNKYSVVQFKKVGLFEAQ